MFAEACSKARNFTRPVVISSRRVDGKCTAAIGAFVVINKEGWAVSAWHIIEEIQKLNLAIQQYHRADDTRKAINAEEGLTKKERGRRLKVLPTFVRESPTNSSSWWSWDGVNLERFMSLPAVDLVFLHLEPFDPSWISEYPVFKDPGKPMNQGRTLCRIGFPFHTIEPVFHADRNVFELPPGSLPLPFFPNDGLFTRTVEVQPDPPLATMPPFPLRMLETSSPGLKGQSGGPLFDQNGTIWGIQSRTFHFPLGFSPSVPKGKPNEKEHQFLNVGWAVHAETIVGMMRDQKIEFSLADY